MAILKRMADFLSQTQRFSVTVDIGFDVVQDSGQKIEFGETRKIVIRRPDRARIDITKGDGATSGFIFDGQQEDRQSYGDQARNQRQDFADDYLDDYHSHYSGGQYYGSYPVGAGLAVADADTGCVIDNPEESADRSSLMDVRKIVDGSELAPTPAGR
jgi:hypothetical protein